VTITRVPVGLGATIKDSRWRVVQHGLEIFLRKISQSCGISLSVPWVITCARNSFTSFSASSGALNHTTRLGCLFAVLGDSFRNLSPLGHADSCLPERNLIQVDLACQSPKLRLRRRTEVG